MEKIIGRKLLSTEIVHHINEDKKDNSPDNLSIESRASHNRKHGTGELLSCGNCGKTRWYCPALISLLRLPYLCRACYVDRKDEKHPLAKLTMAEANRIREMSANGMKGKDLAKMFGVTPVSISEIINMRKYK